ncbi:MAG: TRAP transporter fused permease subunit [Treponema sp.]|nr:TRAP transporter fused permease subunit [Treponema sp.]
MATRKLEGPHKVLFSIVAVMFSGLFMLHSGFRIMPMEVMRPFYLAACSVLAFMLYPITKKGAGAKAVPWYDYVLIALIIATMGYWSFSYLDYAVARFGQSNMTDFYFGLIAIILLFESARRTLGMVIPAIAFVFAFQLYIGPWLPGILAHRGFSLFRIVDYMYRTDQAIFGTITHTFATFVVPFIIMGAFMEVSGATNFFIKLSMSLTRGWAGGPAKVAVIGTAITGSVQGSSVSNVMTTGVFTIPMMKRVGFKAEHAGAIEAAASSGGMILPPVMGAGAFLMASMTETPYIRIVMMSIIPAFLYFYWCIISVHSYAKMNNIKNIPDNEIPDWKETLKEGWFFIVPIALIFILLVWGWSPDRVALAATISCVVLSQFTKDHKMRPKNILMAMETAGKNNVSVGAMIGALGIIMGGIMLGGLAQKFGIMVVMMSGGIIFLAIVLVGFVAIVIGLGSPQTAAYIVMALIVVPGLVVLGVDLVTAHLIAFWFSGLASVTPPVAVACLAASSISGASPMKTAFAAVKYSAMLIILPFAFHYFPSLLLIGGFTPSTVYITVALMISILMLACSIMGFFIRPLSLQLRLVLAFGGLLFFVPVDYLYSMGLAFWVSGLFVLRITDLIGIALLIAVTVIQKRGFTPLAPAEASH